MPRALIVALLLVIHAAAAHGQSSGTFRPLSATVLATYAARAGELTLLVLWRGSPGWHARGGGRSSGGGGGGAPGRESASYYVTIAGRTLTVDIDYSRRVATVLGQAVSLAETNVVLVDGIDTTSGDLSGGRIVGQQWIDPTGLEGPASTRPGARSLVSDPIIAALRRSPDLGSFLQCDTPLPAPTGPDIAAADPAVLARVAEYAQRVMLDTCLAAAGAPSSDGR